MNVSTDFQVRNGETLSVRKSTTFTVPSASRATIAKSYMCHLQGDGRAPRPPWMRLCVARQGDMSHTEPIRGLACRLFAVTHVPDPEIPARFYVETLGCPKNAVDSDKVTASLMADGLDPATSPEEAELVVVNTCAFVEAARQESIDAALALADARKPGAKLVVTGCMAERYGAELAAALPEADLVAGFGVPVTLGSKPEAPAPSMDLLNLPRPRSTVPWAYVKIAEGCDRSCGFCAIPSFRGKQRSRTPASILAEVD